MRAFARLQRDSKIKHYTRSPNGTLYMVLDDGDYPRFMARHFDSELPAELAEPQASLTRAAEAWIERIPELARLVRVEPVVETGEDFILRPFHVYYTSTADYVRDEDPLRPPEDLNRMRRLFRASLGQSDDPKHAVIESVLTRSLLEPTTLTYYGNRVDDPSKGQFVVVEPKVTRDSLERWAALARDSHST